VLPIRYVGIDVQYFAALVIPDANQEKEPQFRHVTAAVVGPDRAEKSNTSVVLTSKEFELEAGDELRHRLKLFAGPKRKTFLAAYGAEELNAYWSWSLAFLGIPQAMGWLLDTFAGLLPKWAWPYGWAIILLTVVVRMLLFPLSKKQVMTAIKMQELQPQIQELKRKYGNDNQKFAQAQLELYRKHNFNPLGCGLVLIIQLPILIALYSTLSMSLDLRLARFLWIDNLAAPDALFTFPFHLPWIGNKFNLLPIITTLLFYLQQKLFTPPPTDPEQAAQQKMMSVMSILISLMFYHMPSGLCLYFIASTLWGLAERQVLPKANRPQAVQEADRGGRREPAAAGRGSAKSKR
jgi:YidC/Oxa1 family membrane protein insertase